MAFTLNDVQNLTASTTASKVSGSVGSAFNTVADATKSAGAKAWDLRPETKASAKKAASEFNARLNAHNLELRKHRIMLEMLAETTGTVLPEDKMLEDYIAEEDKKEAERLEAEQKAAAEKQEKEENKAGHSILDALLDPKVIAAFKTALFPTKEEPVAEAPQLETKEEVDEYMTGNSTTIEEAKEAVKKKEVQQEEAPKNPEEWKQCVSCGTDISVVYKPDTCPHCRRTKEAEEVKQQGGTKPRPRIRFEESTQG
jgi:hypothetical protein